MTTEKHTFIGNRQICRLSYSGDFSDSWMLQLSLLGTFAFSYRDSYTRQRNKRMSAHLQLILTRYSEDSLVQGSTVTGNPNSNPNIVGITALRNGGSTRHPLAAPTTSSFAVPCRWKFSWKPLGVLEHSSSCCCSNPNEETLLLCISVYAVSVDVLTHAVDLHKTASR